MINTSRPGINQRPSLSRTLYAKPFSQLWTLGFGLWALASAPASVAFFVLCVWAPRFTRSNGSGLRRTLARAVGPFGP